MSLGAGRATAARCCALAAGGGALALLPGRAIAQGAAPVAAGGSVERHGLSSFGELKYPKDFKHFDYVFPDAPKGGTLLADRADGRL